MKVLIGTSSFGTADDAPLRRLSRTGLDVVTNPYGRKLANGELRALLTGDVVGIVAGLETLDRGALTASRLRVVSRVGAGTSNVDLQAAAELGILVYATPDAPTQAVAELTLGAMLSLLRGLPAMNDDLHAGRWARRLGGELGGRTVAVVGFGRTGRRVADLLGAFGAKVVVVTRQGETGRLGGFGAMPLADALRIADIVTLHVSGDACILDQPAFEAMKDGALVLNCSRGTCIDEAALVRALDRGRVAGAWIDVFETEPYDGPLTRYDNVLLTPHAASNTAECRMAMEAQATDNLLDGLTKAGLL